MQFKIPQDVLRPDKIVGFLTLRQLIIVAMGGGIAYSLYLVLSREYLVEIWLPPVLFISFITAAFAFVRFHDIVFEKLILIFIEYKFKPRARTWQKMKGDRVASVLSPLRKSSQPHAKAELTAQERRKRLEESIEIVDRRAKEFLSKNSPQTHVESIL